MGIHSHGGGIDDDSSIGVLGFRIPERSIYGLTFQVEQNDTDGMRLLTNFCRDVCGWCVKQFQPGGDHANIVERIEKLTKKLTKKIISK